MGKHGKDHNTTPVTSDMSPQQKADEFDALDRQLSTDALDNEPSDYPALDSYEKDKK